MIDDEKLRVDFPANVEGSAEMNETNEKDLGLRGTELYKTMTSYKATAYAEGFCEGEGASEEDQLIAWQYLHDKGLAYQLQGWFGRQARALIEAGHIEE